MTTRRIKEALGLPKGTKTREAINAAIRMELTAGEHVMDAAAALLLAHRTLGRVAAKDPGGPEAEEFRLVGEALERVQACRDIMVEEVFRRYADS